MDPFIGEIRLFSWNWAPQGWHLCDGSLLPIKSNAALYALLGVQFGGDNKTTFALPDLRGRVMVQAQVPPNPLLKVGDNGGAETVTLTIDQIPSHSHDLCATTAPGGERSPGGNLYTTIPNGTNLYAPLGRLQALSPSVISTTPPAVAHENRQPYIVLNYCIATTGIFPPRA